MPSNKITLDFFRIYNYYGDIFIQIRKKTMKLYVSNKINYKKKTSVF